MTQSSGHAAALLSILQTREQQVLDAWVELRLTGGSTMPTPSARATIQTECSEILDALRSGLTFGDSVDMDTSAYDALRRMLSDMSTREAQAGSSPTETAHAVFSLKDALASAATEGTLGAELLLAVNGVVDSMALMTFEAYVAGREAVISRQTRQLLELSTPVVRLWDGIVGIPLIGTLDSNRASAVMESLLQAIVDDEASVAIIDITGVPTVDTLVAQHLFKTVTATRLMGADCIISGIRPQTAQTIVQLGIDLTGITTRATLADALTTAIEVVARVGAGD